MCPVPEDPQPTTPLTPAGVTKPALKRLQRMDPQDVPPCEEKDQFADRFVGDDFLDHLDSLFEPVDFAMEMTPGQNAKDESEQGWGSTNLVLLH